MSVNFLGFFP